MAFLISLSGCEGLFESLTPKPKEEEKTGRPIDVSLLTKSKPNVPPPVAEEPDEEVPPQIPPEVVKPRDPTLNITRTSAAGTIQENKAGILFSIFYQYDKTGVPSDTKFVFQLTDGKNNLITDDVPNILVGRVDKFVIGANTAGGPYQARICWKKGNELVPCCNWKLIPLQ